MTDFERFASALAMTESNNNPQAFGDDGLAYGRWQMHPAFVDEWWPDDVGVDWSWDQLFINALLRFYDTRLQPGRSLIDVVMEFHLGVQAVKDGKWDKPYAERFTGFYSSIK
jgi:hypothetical protein